MDTSKQKRRPIVVVGSINMDLVSATDRIPVAGQTVLGHSFQMHPGGKGANQAVAVARLGYPVEMIGMLGSDSFGQQLRTNLQSAGVGVVGVGTVEGSSGVAGIIVATTGENSIVVTPGANAAVSPEYIDLHLPLIRNAGLVLAQLEIPIETVEHLAAVCVEEDVPLMLDPAPARELSQNLLHRVRWFTPNETEAAFYAHGNGTGTDFESVAQTARALLSLGPAGVILKLGSRGAYLTDGNQEQRSNAIPVEAIDTTAAGDALNGAFAVGMMMGKSAIESVRFAVAAAAISVTRRGAQPSMPTFDEVKRMLENESDTNK